jgi:hypothetical protein
MRIYHVAHVWSWPSGRRFWQASTEVDCLSPDAVYCTRVEAQNKKQAIALGRRRKAHDDKSRPTG